MDTWYNEHPERWVREQKALEEVNVDFQIEPESHTSGILNLSLKITEQSKIAVPQKFLPLLLTVTFPSTYPYFRPEVSAPEISLTRHQNIVAKNLCLLDRETSNWLPETTLADLLTAQIAQVLIKGEVTDSDSLQLSEDEQAEPVSEYYPKIPNAPVMFDPLPFDKVVANGENVSFLGKVIIGLPDDAVLPSRMMVLESFDTEKNSIGKLPEATSKIFKPRTEGCIYRLQERPPHADATKDYQWLIELLNKRKEKLCKPTQPFTFKKGQIIENIIGLTFPEEHLPGQTSYGWLFIVAYSIAEVKIVNKKHTTVIRKRMVYAKADRINTTELTFRIKPLKPLGSKKIAVFGLGALGGPSAVEFARNNVEELRLVDHDIVDAGPTVRWPLGIAYAGMFKTDAIKNFINDNYLFTNVHSHVFKVGGGDTPDNTKFYSILEGVSLIYDATAERGVNHFLSLEAQRRKIPYICIYGTPGVWGGVCLRVVPDITEGCWMCFQYSLIDGTIPVPATNREGNVQAPGCGDISFTGASFELANIVSSGVRLAVSNLCSTGDDYVDLNSDVGILSLVDDHGKPIFPKWSTHQLKKHPQCPYCNLKAVEI